MDRVKTLVADLDLISAELRAYDAELLDRPQIVAITKMDLPHVRERLPAVARELEARERGARPISAVTHEGIDRLLSGVRVKLEEQQAARQELMAPSRESEEFVFTAERRAR